MMTKLENYMNLRGMGVVEFSEHVGVSVSALESYLSGGDMLKSDIDKILNRTGMEYEKMFKEW
ncbi:MAG: hypothetical protein K2P14_01865 [Anaeroplasmataceae bacterium]|nr:hypothetical protein [Anaeroplasmataceae bacterium]